MITFQVERWASYYPECEWLWKLQYAEVGPDREKVALKMDIPSYEDLDSRGQLFILTARERGSIIGYYLAIVRTHLHYADLLCAFEDIYFVAPANRKGLIGFKLLKEAEKRLKARGVKKVFVMTKKSKNVSRLFERLGYTVQDIGLVKWIGD